MFYKKIRQATNNNQRLIFQWPEGYTQDNSFYVVEQMKSENVDFTCPSFYGTPLLAVWSVEQQQEDNNSILIQLKPQGGYIDGGYCRSPDDEHVVSNEFSADVEAEVCFIKFR